MISIFPSGFLTSQELKQTLPPDGIPSRLNDKSTSSAGADEFVDFSHQIFW
jgi:hypothetical protein